MTQLGTAPVPLGFYLARPEVESVSWPGISYRGIDRLPYTPSLEEEAELSRAGRDRLLELWDRFAEISYDLWKAFSLPDLVALRQGFEDEGLSFEIVFGEISAVPNDLSSYASGPLWKKELDESLTAWVQHTKPQSYTKPIDLVFLGHDVSHPFQIFILLFINPDWRRSIRAFEVGSIRVD